MSYINCECVHWLTSNYNYTFFGMHGNAITPTIFPTHSFNQNSIIDIFQEIYAMQFWKGNQRF